jgi:MFS family permease
MPESIESLIARRPSDALDRINRTLARLGLETIDALPSQSERSEQPSIASLFSPTYARVTVLLTVAYFAQIMLFYYVQKWIPKIVVDLGFAPASAGRVLVWANVGNLLGALMIGLAAQRLSLRPLIVGAMIGGFAAITVFGLGFQSLERLSLIAMVAGFFINASVVGLYPILAQVYPAALRASGIGFVIGVGRGGSAVGPVVAGALFTAGAGLLWVSLTMGAGALIAATMLLLLPRALSSPSTVQLAAASAPAHR